MTTSGKARSLRRIARDLELHGVSLHESADAAREVIQAAAKLRSAADLIDPPKPVKLHQPDF